MASDETVTQQVYQSPVHYLDQPDPVAAAEPATVTTDAYTVTGDTYHDYTGQITAGLQDFFHSHLEGSVQVFHSLTLGEVVESILLAAILIVLVARWIWEVV